MSERAFLFGDEHVHRYVETDGEDGFAWREGSSILILTTTGRRSGREISVPLIFGVDGDAYVLVASKGGAPRHPGWFLNLHANPEVVVQVKAERFRARARVAEGEEREHLWRLMNTHWRHYDEYQARTDRQIPIVVLERV
jgi:deazaflavin-dependent oxidoreductase (nitroreductase family)